VYFARVGECDLLSVSRVDRIVGGSVRRVAKIKKIMQITKSGGALFLAQK